MNILETRLSGGIRLVHLNVSGRVAHCGIFINAGARDEKREEHGLAHFIEHTIFKGTKKRKVHHILNRLENVGADLDAYTTKEETCINATFLKEYYPRVIELFSDIFFHSVFPDDELEREKRVVADEIRSYQDNPAEQIFDDFEDLVFTGHPLGRNILGSARSLKTFTRDSIYRFIERNYYSENVVIVSVGDIRFAKLLKWMESAFGTSAGDPATAGQRRIPFTGYQPVLRERKKKGMQVHCILGGTAYAHSDDRRYPLALLNNMLGGPVMNSRLSIALREKHGLTYMNESNYTAYSDSGIVSIYFGTDRQHFEKASQIVSKELKRLREVKLSPLQLHIIKKQLSGQLAISAESNMALMLAMGKNYLLHHHFEPVETIMARIGGITAGEVAEVANEIFAEERLSRLVYL